MKQRVKIIISADGLTVSCETLGFSGPACVDTLKKLTDALGGNITESKHTADYHKLPECSHTNRNFNVNHLG